MDKVSRGKRSRDQVATALDVNNNESDINFNEREAETINLIQRDTSGLTFSKSALNFASNSVIEPIAFVIAFASAIRNLVRAALIQDKVCLQKFALPADFCRNIAEEDGPMKDEVLKAAASLVTTKELLILLPIVVNAIYIGSWCDRYPNGKRYCLIVNCFSLIFESFLLFLNSYFFDGHYIWTIIAFLPPAFFGSGFGVTTTIYSYISHMHHQSDRNMRFIVAQICSYLGGAAGTFFSALVLPTKPFLTGHQLQNYTAVFLASTVAYLFVIIWTGLFVRKDDKLTRKGTRAPGVNGEGESCPILKGASEKSRRTSTSRVNSFFGTLRDLFDPSHIRDVYIVMTKERANFLRQKAWLLIANLNLILLAYYSINVAYPFVQKVYNWDAVYFSLASTVNMLLRPTLLLLFMPFILKLIKLSDLEIALLGIVSSFLGLIIVGSITSSVGIWLQMIFGSISALGSTGTRAYISRVLPRDEVSRIFGIIITIEAAQPFLSALFYNSIFNYSISWYPTLAFHAAAGISIVSMLIVVYVDLLDRWYPIAPL